MTNAPLPDILTSVQPVIEAARHVSIDQSALDRLADRLAVEEWGRVRADECLAFTGSREDCANFTLLYDALNFCFWSDQPWEVEYRGETWMRTDAMQAGLLRAIGEDAGWLQPQRWAQVEDGDLAHVFRGKGTMPLLDRRREVLRETGAIVCDRFGASFANAVQQAGSDARSLAYLLTEVFPSFRDVARYAGKPVAFLKRAQICAADLHRIWLANGFDGLTGLERLTVFADYRLPQLLRHEGVAVPAPKLARRIDSLTPIPAGSEEEVELRAATIWVGELLCEALARRGQAVHAWRLDYELWRRARNPAIAVPHHRTITHFY